LITRADLEEAVAECNGLRNPNANTCIKLAAYYTILNEMDKAEQEPVRILPAYSGAADPPENTVRIGSRSRFAEIVDGTELGKFYNIMDELMDTLQVVNPPLYAGVLRKFQE